MYTFEIKLVLFCSVIRLALMYQRVTYPVNRNRSLLKQLDNIELMAREFGKEKVSRFRSETILN